MRTRRSGLGVGAASTCWVAQSSMSSWSYTDLVPSDDADGGGAVGIGVREDSLSDR
jgi:hypothetical protein